jgi:hypothetical protein
MMEENDAVDKVFGRSSLNRPKIGVVKEIIEALLVTEPLKCTAAKRA